MYTSHLLASGLAPMLSTPRAHWRQLPIKGGGLFHCTTCKSRKQRCKVVDESPLCTQGHRPSASPCIRLAPRLSTPRAHKRQLLIKQRQLAHAVVTVWYNFRVKEAMLRSGQRVCTLCTVRPESDSPTLPTVRQSDSPTVSDSVRQSSDSFFGARTPSHSDSRPTVRQPSDSSPTVGPTVVSDSRPTVVRQFRQLSDSSDSSHSQGLRSVLFLGL